MDVLYFVIAIFEDKLCLYVMCYNYVRYYVLQKYCIKKCIKYIYY